MLRPIQGIGTLDRTLHASDHPGVQFPVNPRFGVRLRDRIKRRQPERACRAAAAVG